MLDLNVQKQLRSYFQQLLQVNEIFQRKLDLDTDYCHVRSINVKEHTGSCYVRRRSYCIPKPRHQMKHTESFEGAARGLNLNQDYDTRQGSSTKFSHGTICSSSWWSGNKSFVDCKLTVKKPKQILYLTETSFQTFLPLVYDHVSVTCGNTWEYIS